MGTTEAVALDVRDGRSIDSWWAVSDHALMFLQFPRALDRIGNMTMDEKLEFLRRSTESLHTGCQELHATAVEQGRQIMAEARRSQRREWAIFAAMVKATTSKRWTRC